MTYCPECGEKGRKNATFCDFCGAELPEWLPEPRRMILSSEPRRLPGSTEVVPASKATVSIPRALLFFLFLVVGGVLAGKHIAHDVEVIFFLPLVFYLLHLQRRQMATLNSWLGERKLSFAGWVIWSLFTAGLYALFIEWRMAKIINRIQRENGLPGTPGLASICLGISVLIPGIGTIVSIFIQQHEINRFYNPRYPGDPRRTEE